MTVTVRGLLPSDRPRVAGLLDDAGFWDQAMSVRLGHRTHYEVFVAVDETGEAVGYLDGNLSSHYDERIARYVPPPQAWGSTMAVAESHRRRGVGRALIAAFVRAARQVGSTQFVCKVDESSDTTERMAFFAACGLRPVLPEQDDDVVAGAIDDVLRACER